MKNHLTDISNVLVIGCGGAGLRAAIEVKKNDLNVKIIGKRRKNDAHTVLAAGGINAAFGNIDKDDNWLQHFADTYLEGYGLGNPEIIEIMAKESPKLVKEIDSWGANLEKLKNGKLDQRFFGAHTYRRTCYSGDFTGQSIIQALLKRIKLLNIPIYDSQYVTDLLINDNTCFGAMSINTKNGERTVHLADSVILCTGGHTKIWFQSSSRKLENYGDGYDLALKAGCDLIDMEMVQFHPTGMIKPDDFAGTLVTEAVRGEGGKLFNVNGERFMQNYDKKRMELSTRDKVAIANYTEIIEGRSSPNGGVFLDISHKPKDFILNKIPKIYRQFIESQMLDISQKPMEVAPTAHYSMGGILVDSYNHSTSVKGLFAAGEVAGGLHGANRLGGNSLAEILVFGKLSGIAASSYSIKLKAQIRSQMAIKKIHENINKFIKNGEELVIALQNELSKVMWEKCGVIKNEEKLKLALEKIDEIEKRAYCVDIRISDNNFQDLIKLFDLNSSIKTAKATLLSAIERKESRGAHQRSDYPFLKASESCSYLIKEKEGLLQISRKDCIGLNSDLRKQIDQTVKINDFKNRLLE
tara:strand:+ start:7528 stop:9273 length:1746 start_codon:yes stop_codon:yes gene_type:complete